MTHKYFAELNLPSTITNSVLEKAKAAPDSQWYDVLDQSLFQLSYDDFEPDSGICKVINDLKSHDRLAIYRFPTNVCFQWHIDRARQSAINMLLTGFDSFCAFGIPVKGNRFANIEKLEHEPNTYYLMNVKQFHCVYNFSEPRYVLSIGIGDIPYTEVLEYLKTNNLISK